jgi:hypothetical protein
MRQWLYFLEKWLLGFLIFWSGFLQFKAQSRGAAGAHAEMRQQLVRALGYVKIRLRADFHGGGS